MPYKDPEAKKASDREYGRRNADRLREYHAAYYAANRERCLERQREWRTANAERKKALRKEYYWRTREVSKAKAKQWAEANPEKTRARGVRRYVENKEAIRAKLLAWEKANPDRVRASVRRKDARRRSAIADAVRYVSADALTAKWEYWNGSCWMCGCEATTWDHVKPLAAGGSHILANLRPACRSCNSRKQARWPYPTARAQVA